MSKEKEQDLGKFAKLLSPESLEKLKASSEKSKAFFLSLTSPDGASYLAYRIASDLKIALDNKLIVLSEIPSFMVEVGRIAVSSQEFTDETMEVLKAQSLKSEAATA